MGIRANELRIGNWIEVVHEDSSSFRKITASDIELFERCENNPDHDCWSRGKPNDWLKSIPLTPEVLEKCGFTKDNYGCFSIPLLEPDQLLWTKHYKSEIKSGWSFSISIGFAEDVQGLPDKNFIHEVQNLYFALTQTEIEYKP